MVLNGSFKDSVEVLLKKTKKQLNIAFGASEGSSRKTATYSLQNRVHIRAYYFKYIHHIFRVMRVG